MDHGFLGEARTRAFLAERFWILERSVDIEGADFLVQRRLTDLRDQDAPMLGSVQAKFIQDEGTTIYIAEIREHRERHDRLRDAGLLDAFLALPKQIEDYLVADLSRMTKPSAADAVYVLSMTYEPTTLAVTRFASRIGTRPHPEKNRLWIERDGVTESAPGALEVWWAVFDH
jgi:hypothetical protein